MILENFWYQFICVFIIGLIMGSFYNVVIVRTLSGESIIYPQSKCPYCNTRLKWFENIPIFSFFMLRGKCSYCHNKIDLMYPIVEILSALLYGLLYIKFGLEIKYLLSIALISILLILAVMDIKKQQISTNLSYGFIIVSILFNYSNLLNSILGFLIGIGIIYSFRTLLNFAFKKEVLGEGDIYAVCGISALYGFNNLVYMFLSIILFQFLYSLPIIIKKIIKTKQYIFCFLFIWFILAYIIAYLYKIYYINLGMFFLFLIFLNLIISIFFLLKYLLKNISCTKNSISEPILPSIFLSGLLFLFLI